MELLDGMKIRPHTFDASLSAMKIAADTRELF